MEKSGSFGLLALLSTPIRLVWNRPLSLRVKLIIAAILVALPSFLLTLIGVAILVSQQRAEAPRADLATANTGAYLVDSAIDDAIAVGWLVATTPEAQTLSPNTLDPMLERLRSVETQIGNVGVFDTRGVSVGEMIPYPSGTARQNVAGKAFFRQTLQTNQPRVSGVETDPRTGRPALMVGVPLRGSSGQPRGVVVVSLDLDRFQTRLASVAENPPRVILVTDPSGRLALEVGGRGANQGISAPPSGANFAAAPLIAGAIHNGSAIQQSAGVPPLGGDWLGAARAGPRYHWIVAVLQSPVSAFDPLTSVVWFEFFALLLSVALAVIAARYVSMRIVGPMRSLRHAARAWSEGNLNERVDIPGGDEFAQLGQTFNQMASSLSDSLRRLTDADLHLINQRNRLRAILNTSPVGILVMDNDERIVLANPAAETLLGESFVAEKPASAYEVIAELRHSNETAYRYDELPIVCALRTGETVVGDEVLIHHPNGWDEHLLVNAAPIRESDGRVIGSVAAFFDVSPLAEEQRLRTEFVVSAAQEFRNPLTVIKGYAEIAMRDPTVRETNVRDELERILRAAKRLATLSDQVVHAAQLHLPALILHHEPLDLAALVTRATHEFEAKLPSGRYQITLDTRTVQVEGDPKLLAEAVTDLLRQAAAAMPEGGAIEIRVSTWDGIATLSVTDHGPIVPQEKIPSLFRAFALPGHDIAGNERPNLLLYLAKRIVEESGGWIRAQSTPRGTVIAVTLPRLTIARRQAQEEDTRARAELAIALHESDPNASSSVGDTSGDGTDDRTNREGSEATGTTSSRPSSR